MKDFAGKSAVVTGAGGGIGRALAHRFAAAQMNVVVADVNAVAADNVASELKAAGGSATAVRTDVTQPDDVMALAATAESTYGKVHILCNNAGIIRPGSIWEQSLEDWHTVVDVNMWGVIHGLRAFVPRMLAHGEEAHIVNTASAGGLLPIPFECSYTASKFAVEALSEELADELDALGTSKIGVSVLCPGGVATDLFQSEVLRLSEADSAEHPVGIAKDRWEQLSDSNRKDMASPEYIAGLVFDAIRSERFFVLPMQAPLRARILERLRTIEKACAESPDYA